jgi:hypothetical protein
VVIDTDVYLQNNIVEGDVRFFSTNVTMGSEVTNQMSPGPVYIEENSSLTISKSGEVLIDKGVTVSKGGLSACYRGAVFASFP